MKSFIHTTGEIIHLLGSSLLSLRKKPFYFLQFNEQIVQIGYRSLSITIVIGLVAGLVMTLEFGHGLEKFGGVLYVPTVVSLSLVRELVPVFVSLLIAGRVGSGITAELGSMHVTQQIDALRALAVSPIKYLVVPRIFAGAITLPLLTVIGILSGLLGGLFISWFEFNLYPYFFFNKVIEALDLSDLFTGLFKTVFFSLIITLLACYKGMNTQKGTRGVGDASTWVVVYSSILILISDFFLTKLFIIFIHE